MIATGTDAKPIECVFFMRNVKSAGYFEQMKGRGVRVISPDKLRTVSRSATAKDRFIIVDAVGVCEQDKTDSHTLNRQPKATLQELLNYVAAGGTDSEALTTLASRLSRLQREFSGPQLAELQELAGGHSLGDLSNGLLNACEPDAGGEAARDAAIVPFSKPAFRKRLLEIRQQNEQVIDRHTIDEVLYSGFDVAALDKARAKVRDFREWIHAHKDELTALQVIYGGVRPLKISRTDLRQLRDSLERPPLAATAVQLWRAFEAVEAQHVRERGGPTRAGEPLADLVQLVRHAIAPESKLEPYADQVRMNYALWMRDKERAGVTFAPEQREWLDRMAEHIATSLEIQVVDFEAGWFGQQGSLGRAHALFGRELNDLLRELNERLAA